jgi:hypothetical protein
MVKHCPHIVLKAFDGFELLVHLQTTHIQKKKKDHGALFFLGANEEWHTHFIVSQHKAKLCDDAETFHKRRQRRHLLACANPQSMCADTS